MPLQITYLRGNQEEPQADLRAFYAALEKEEVFPSSLPPSFGRYTALFDQLLIEYDHVLVIEISPTFSESYARARDAATAFGNRVIVHNSRSLSMGTGLQALAAARMIQDGATLEAVLERLRAQTAGTYSMLVPASMKYLRNSRRIGNLAMTVATFLNIMPVLACEHDLISMVSRSLSFQESVGKMLDAFCERYTDAPPNEIGVTHANSPLADAFYQQVQARFPGVPTYLSDVGPVMAVNSGPGALGISAYRI